MSRVAIPNLEVKVWTRKSELPQGDFLSYLTQPENTRQLPFELTDIGHYQIKDEIKKMEYVEYNTDIGINVKNVDNIEDFANF